MKDSMLFMILLQVFLILLNAVFACAEIAVISVNDAKLAQLAQAGDRRAVRLARLTSQPARFLATIQVKNPAQDNTFYSKKQENNADNSVIIEGEVVKESVIEKYIKEINQSKIGLDSDVASALSSLTDIMKKMDSYISNHQNNEKDIKVMTEYYIPELLKHIKVFKELSSGSFKSVHNDDIKNEPA